MLLVESLIHGLIARSVISVAEAVEIVEVAAEVKTEIAEELGIRRSSCASRSLSFAASGKAWRQ